MPLGGFCRTKVSSLPFPSHLPEHNQKTERARAAEAAKMGKGLEEIQPIFGEAKAEWERSTGSQTSLSPFLYHLEALDSSRLRILVSDFESSTWESIRTVQHLEDLRDVIGVGGSWSEFVQYLIASFSSDNVKLVLGGVLNSTGPTSAKIVAHKSKGMPLVSVSLSRLLDSSAEKAKANITFELFKAYKEQERSYQLTKMLDAEQEKNESIQNQLDAVAFSSKRKQQKSRASDKAFPISYALDNLDTMVVSGKQQSSDKPPNKDLHSTKVGNRVVPAYRRVKVRGAVLQNNEDNEDK